MQKLIFINGNNEQINLTAGDFGITEWAGLSANDLEVQSQQVPFQDGSVFLDAIYGQREIAVTVSMNDNNDLTKRYTLRRQLIKVLNAKLGEGVLIYENNFLRKQIKAVPHLPEFENHNSNDSGIPKANIVFECCSPYWEDVEYSEINLTGGQRTSVEIEGDVCSPVEIDYSGYASSLIIDNLTTGKSLELLDIGSNRRIDISTYVGNKSVYATELEKDNKYFAIKCQWMQNFGSDYLVYFKFDTDNNKTTLYVEKSDGEFKIVNLPYLLSKWQNKNSFDNTSYRGNYIYYSEFVRKYYALDGNFLESTDLINWSETSTAYYQEHDYIFRINLEPFKWEIAKIAGLAPSFTDITSLRDDNYFFWCTNGYYHIFDNSGIKYSNTGFLENETIIKNTESVLRLWNLTEFDNFIAFSGNYGAGGGVFIFNKDNTQADIPMPAGTYFESDIVRLNNDKYISAPYTYKQTFNGQLEDLSNKLKLDDVKGFVMCSWQNKLFLRYIKDGEYFIGYTESFDRAIKMEDVELTGLSMQNNLYYGYANGKIYYSQNLMRFYFWANCPVIDIFRDNLGAGNQTGFEIVNGNIETFTHPVETVHSIRKLNNKYYIAGVEGLYESEDKIQWTSIITGIEVYDVAWTGQLVYTMDTEIQNGDTHIENTETFIKMEYSEYYGKLILQTSSSIFVSTTDFIYTELDTLEGTIQDILYDERGLLWWILTDEKIYTYYRDLLSEMAIDATGTLALSRNGCVIINCFLTECQYKSNTNIIDHLGADSNMGFCLETGSNTIYFQGGQKDLIKIKYKNRFLGV